MRAVILYRKSLFSAEEKAAAQRHFECTDSRMDIRAGDLVVGRFSVLPFFDEQERDIKKAGARLINSFEQHSYIAGMRGWVQDLGDLTPQTWYRAEDMPEEGSFVVKGMTNSKKFRWDEEFFAPTKRVAIEIGYKLSLDSLIGQQEIYYRRYVPLVTYLVGIHGLPVTKEFRFFVAYGKILCGAYYWSSHVEDLKDAGIAIPSVEEVPQEFLETCIKKIGDNAAFYALDVGQTQAGEWIVIELNDGSMSGLSENDPDTLYRKLKEAIEGKLA